MASCWLMNENADSCSSYTYTDELENELHLAVKESKIECVFAIVNSGLPVSFANIYGETALHIAVRKDNDGIILLLLIGGAEVDVESGSGETPLELAVTFGHQSALATLLDFLRITQPFRLEELINKYYTGGISLLHMATDINVLALLIRYGIYVNMLSKKGDSPLHYAASRGDLFICIILVHAGTPIDARNHEGKTPMSLAIEAGHDAVALFLDDFIKDNEFKNKWFNCLVTLFG